MKQYKLIKEYPGSPKVGTIAYQTGFTSYQTDAVTGFPQDIIEGNDFWKEIKEKEYEILSLMNTDTKNIFDDTSRGTYQGRPMYYSRTSNTWIGIQELANNKQYIIHSVKRLSDGEVFTIGDKIQSKFNNSVLKGILIKITLEDGYGQSIRIYFDNKHMHNLNNVIHSKQPLFTTEDGVDMYKDSDYYLVCTETFPAEIINNVSVQAINENDLWKINMIIVDQFRVLCLHRKGIKRFSNKKAAEEYILRNKPCLSYEDVLNFMFSNPGTNAIYYKLNSVVTEHLKQVIKKKLK